MKHLRLELGAGDWLFHPLALALRLRLPPSGPLLLSLHVLNLQISKFPNFLAELDHGYAFLLSILRLGPSHQRFLSFVRIFNDASRRRLPIRFKSLHAPSASCRLLLGRGALRQQPHSTDIMIQTRWFRHDDSGSIHRSLLAS